MIYSKCQLGLDLKSRILAGSSGKELSKWAYKIYIEHGSELEEGLDSIVLKLVAMDEGGEFLLTQEALQSLAHELIFDDHTNN